jgi:phage terminase small subunit
MDNNHPEIMPFMKPAGLSAYGRSVWDWHLDYLKNTELTAADYVLLEQFCHLADQLRTLNIKIAAQPVMVVDGIIKPNPLQWNAQALIRTLIQTSASLLLNRKARDTDDEAAKSQELLNFLRGGTNG